MHSHAYDSPFEPHDLREETFSLLVSAIRQWILPQKFRKNRLRRNVLCRRDAGLGTTEIFER